MKSKGDEPSGTGLKPVAEINHALTISSHWSAVAYVIDTPSRRLESLIIHTQPTSADTGESAVIHTPADVGWKSGCPDKEIMAETIERVSME
jgi:hypothetical protein